MTRLQFAERAAVAAPLSGALCSLGFMLIYFAVEVWNRGPGAGPWGFLGSIFYWMFPGAPIGMAAGIALGAVPGIVSIVAWPALERQLGARRAIEVSVLVVGLIGFLETLSVAWAFRAASLEAVGWALGVAVVSALTLRWLLRHGLRAAERRAARAVAPY
ncbi:hypothetical protein H1W00_13630 [Aeromicrobium sp. Marseille-Q0843]|uniref:Uncharacterized protein n=1 Tax=Aeromicrobium phoceense TaxID=2754045 RepID=A0A838XHG0_9ACTN|nr:hypothetical protein [Aeromicrobium phoceense]MBA4609522.1 hypothetical protein [Aeromicrobium phoceense]